MAEKTPPLERRPSRAEVFRGGGPGGAAVNFLRGGEGCSLRFSDDSPWYASGTGAALRASFSALPAAFSAGEAAPNKFERIPPHAGVGGHSDSLAAPPSASSPLAFRGEEMASPLCACAWCCSLKRNHSSASVNCPLPETAPATLRSTKLQCNKPRLVCRFLFTNCTLRITQQAFH